MTKLLLANGSFYEDHLVTPLTYLLAYDVLNDLAGDVIAADRYTLDVEHEQHMRQIANEFDALFDTLLTGGWYKNHDH